METDRKIYEYNEGDYNCDKCGVLGDFNGGGNDFPDGYIRVSLFANLVDMNIEWDDNKGNSRNIFHDECGCYCDDCITEIVNNYKKKRQSIK